jgi:predicted nucleic acid-binding protein
MILDTNSLSAFADGVEAVVSVVHSARSVALSVISLGEFRFGIAQSRHRLDYERWLRENLGFYGILTISEETASAYAEIRLELKQAGRPIPVNDLWIAAQCRQHDLPILSRDTHFDAVKDVRRVGW